MSQPLAKSAPNLLPLAARLLAELPGLKADDQAGLLALMNAEPSAHASEVALEVLEHMDAATGVLAGMACAEVLRRHGTAAQLPRLQAVRSKVPGFTGLRDWRADIDGAVAALQAVAQQRCRCASVYANNTAPWGDGFEVLQRTEEPYLSVLQVRCSACGRHFEVTVDDSYHYPIFTWK